MYEIMDMHCSFNIVAIGIADKFGIMSSLFITREQYMQTWILPRQRFDNHDMALMLIEILYEQNLLNEATYKKILLRYGGSIDGYGHKRETA
ncbi:MAG TPA: hypothetical protein H9742_08615 [Candidatus Acetatifactor stercoripullorum]|uniref:Uncharacterized protein n=1 Tax=Candidatus Acetatifactor stercoripullorum TaxID=2838414 RepID=A0A9D1R5X1_9FIRM|nr:hypothetical protein [uncultured Acetatifactor sp.]HIW81565.1 hypothetical protein [Candidatus Acetatifactor stercoripullorum]